MTNKTAAMMNLEKLKDNWKDECLGAYFCGGFGGALVEFFDVDKIAPEKLAEKVGYFYDE